MILCPYCTYPRLYFVSEIGCECSKSMWWWWCTQFWQCQCARNVHLKTVFRLTFSGDAIFEQSLNDYIDCNSEAKDTLQSRVSDWNPTSFRKCLSQKDLITTIIAANNVRCSNSVGMYAITVSFLVTCDNSIGSSSKFICNIESWIMFISPAIQLLLSWICRFHNQLHNISLCPPHFSHGYEIV